MKLPELGVGIVYVPGLEPLLEPGNTCVDVLEIEPQALWNYKCKASQPYSLPDYTLQHLRSLTQPKIIHSVGFGLGGTHRASKIFAEALAKTVKTFDAPWASEHLSFTYVGFGKKAFFTGFMMPALHTVEGAITAAESIIDLGNQLPVPLAVETTVNYLKPRKGELSDGEFVALAVEKADCGILLDLHNIWANEQNGRQTVKDFLATIPLERVWEIHLAGGFESNGYWLDAHSGAVPESVMELTEELIPALPNLRAVIYEIFPAFIPLFGLDAIEEQLDKIKAIYTGAKQLKASSIYHQSPSQLSVESYRDQEAHISPHLWEKTLGELVTNGDVQGLLATELDKDESIPLLKDLIWRFRAGSIVKTLSVLTKLMLLCKDDGLFESLLNGYFEQAKPAVFASEEARGFLKYLRQQEIDIPYLRDILLYEEASMQALMDQKNQYVHFDHDPRELLQALTEGYIPEGLVVGSYQLEIQPEIELNESAVG